MFRLISISGFARSGKNTLADAISQIVKKNCCNFSFAGQLKQNLNHLLVSSFKISSFTEDDYEKKIIRPILIAYGQAAREINPNYWIERVEQSVRKYSFHSFADLSNTNIYATVSDQRFPNEFEWTRSMGGKTIWVERVGYGPANEDEANYTAQLKERADYQIVWNDLGENAIEKALPFAKNALESLYGSF